MLPEESIATALPEKGGAELVVALERAVTGFDGAARATPVKPNAAASASAASASATRRLLVVAVTPGPPASQTEFPARVALLGPATIHPVRSAARFAQLTPVRRVLPRGVQKCHAAAMPRDASFGSQYF